MPLHVLLAAIRHETNSFSPLPTPFEAFFPDGEPVAGDAVLAAHDGAKTAFGGLLDGARAAGAAIALPLFADALPSAPADPRHARPADRAAPRPAPTRPPTRCSSTCTGR